MKTYTLTVAAGSTKTMIIPDTVKVPFTIMVIPSGGATADIKAKLDPADTGISWDEGEVTTATETARYSPVYSYDLIVTGTGSAILRVRG